MKHFMCECAGCQHASRTYIYSKAIKSKTTHPDAGHAHSFQKSSLSCNMLFLYLYLYPATCFFTFLVSVLLFCFLFSATCIFTFLLHQIFLSPSIDTSWDRGLLGLYDLVSCLKPSRTISSIPGQQFVCK